MPRKRLPLKAIPELTGNLHEAAAMGDVSVLQTLLDNERKVTDADSQQSTALHYACRNGKMNAMMFLLSNGGDINAKTIAGITPLMCAAANNHLEIVQRLLSAGQDSADMLLAESDSQLTALDYAVINHHYEVAAELGRTMLPFTVAKTLFQAVEMDDLTFVKCYMMLNQVSPNVVNEHGHTMLMVACCKPISASTTKTIQYLLTRTKLDVNYVDKKKNTAIILAIKNPSAKTDISVIQAIVETDKADCNLADAAGMTPFLWAVALKLRAVLALLVNYYGTLMNTSVRDNKGRGWEKTIASSSPQGDPTLQKYITSLLPKKKKPVQKLQEE